MLHINAIRTEMIASGMHSSTQDPPNTTMFERAGGDTPYKMKDQPSLSQTLMDAVTAIASALPGHQVQYLVRERFQQGD